MFGIGKSFISCRECFSVYLTFTKLLSMPGADLKENCWMHLNTHTSDIDHGNPAPKANADYSNTKGRCVYVCSRRFIAGRPNFLL